MDKDKKDKIKKKKMIKKDETEKPVEDKKIVKKTNVASEVEDTTFQKENKDNKINSSERDIKDVPNEFYIAHPRSIEKTTDSFQDVHSRKLAELLEAFHIFDFDRDGIINHDDLKKTFASLNRHDVEDEEINQMLSEGLNPLDFDAFVILLGYKTLDLDPEEVFADALSNWDEHREGLISYEILLHDIMVWGDKFTEDEATAALADAPIVFTKTKEKMIDYVQFSEDLCSLRKMMQRKQPNKLEN